MSTMTPQTAFYSAKTTFTGNITISLEISFQLIPTASRRDHMIAITQCTRPALHHFKEGIKVKQHLSSTMLFL